MTIVRQRPTARSNTSVGRVPRLCITCHTIVTQLSHIDRGFVPVSLCGSVLKADPDAMVDCVPPSSSDGLGCAGRGETRHSEWLCSRRGPCMSAGVVSRVEPAGVVGGLHGNNESALHDMEPHRRSRTSIVHPLSHICTQLSHNVHSIVTQSAHHSIANVARGPKSALVTTLRLPFSL